jgi:TolB-like protein/Tfp pilus assembly protein PilF
VADVVLDGIEAPAWVMKVFLFVAALGFPIVLLFSWAYELTPEGIKKEKDVDRSHSITPETGRKLNIITIGLLVAVMAFTAADRLWLEHPAHEGVAMAPAVEEVSEQSIAVLAFEDLSPDGDQAYFAEGLSEELLNVLARVSELKVAGRTSSFAFKGQQKDLREIGELLNVAHILEGSVRKAGNRIRVTAQLIKASDGFHLYSETFDRDLHDVFAVQDEIATAISKALLTEMLGTGPDEVATTDPEAFELYLMARQRIHSRDIYNLREANTMLDRALEIDPIYAPALAQKALATYLMSDSIGAYGDIPLAETMPVSRRYVDQALALDPSLAEAHAVNGLLLDDMDRYDEAIVALNRALEINPNLSDAGNWLASALVAKGERVEALEVLERVVQRDPTYGPGFNNLINAYARVGAVDEAKAIIDRNAQIVGENDDIKHSRGTIAIMEGDMASAARSLREALEFNPNATVTQFWYGLALLGLADHDTLLTHGPPEYKLRVYAHDGDDESAQATINSIDLDGAFVPRIIWEVGHYYNRAGNTEAYLDYIIEHFGSVDSLIERRLFTLGWGTSFMGELAFALRRSGDEEAAERLLVQMHDRLDEEIADGATNWLVVFNQAELAALSGDSVATAERLNTAMDYGFRYIDLVDSEIFSAVADDEAMIAARERLEGLVNVERAKMGLPPYRPLPAADEDASRPSFVN